jgi:hypothetical protein
MSHRHLLLIAGMHRSGTSALCAALERCGASFGTDLLDPMAGVNEEGFWEDTAVVQLNQQLLERLGGTWFCLPPAIAQVDWSGADLADLQQAAQAVLRRGFGVGPLQAVKDPRLCITLPFWLAACAALQLPVTVCVMQRAPLEVARSLQKRDGFPLGYGLRLYAQYRHLVAAHLSPQALFVTYDTLMQEPTSVMQALAATLPLTLPEAGLAAAVRPELRHHREQQGDPLLLEADTRDVDLTALYEAIEHAFPGSELLSQFALCLVQRGEQLTRLGGEHTQALATLAQRDADVDKLSALHCQALATIDERDAQIVEFDRRLADTGAHLSRALDTLTERDQQLVERDQQIARMLATPGVRLLLRVHRWVHERR